VDSRSSKAVRLLAGLALLFTIGAPDARELTRDLQSNSAEARDEAARRLLAMGTSAQNALAEAAKSGTPAARRRARALLAIIEDGGEGGPDERRREADAVVRAARQRDGELRAGSAHDDHLSQMGDAASRAIARAARREADLGPVRPHTAAAIGRHPSAAGVSVLASALRGHRILGSSLVEVARQLEGDPAGLLPDDARGDLEAVLAIPDDRRRRGAAALLAALDNETADRFMQDPDPRVRLEGAHALGCRRSAAAGAALERLAEDMDAEVRRAALEALLLIPGRPRFELAHASAADADAGVRAAAADLLARDAVPESMAVLHRLSSDESRRVRAAAERSLAVIAAIRQRSRAAANAAAGEAPGTRLGVQPK